MIEKRIFKINNIEVKKGTVIYKMSRDQRVSYNHAILYGMETAKKMQSDFIVCFNLVSNFLNAPQRHFEFMLKGLEETALELQNLNIPFLLLIGKPEQEVPKLIDKTNAGILITDFDPLKIKLKWNNDINSNINIAFHEVDTHNIIPVRYISQKEEFAAYTLRPKVRKLEAEFLYPVSYPEKFEFERDNTLNNIAQFEKIDYSAFDKSVSAVPHIIPGRIAALKTLERFISNRLEKYDTLRNEPGYDYQSELSPYLHFGQISSLEAVITAQKANAPQEAKDSFIEEIFVRKELADNYCLYNQNYDSFDGFRDWAKNTLLEHIADTREYIYSLEQFETAKTHDPYWNAAQKEMTRFGKMHGYMRMYWAKKILEWSETPEQAIETAIYLNDKYSLDGRDPNGYTGIAWSIGGIHDRGWTERSVFGKIRFMNDKGLKRKFDMDAYLRKVDLIKLV